MTEMLRHVTLLLTCLLILGPEAITCDYLSDEMECPGNIAEDLFFPGPWIPPGTPSRALMTLPAAFSVRLSGMPGGGVGVYSNTFMPANTWLSEYEGEYVPGELADYRDSYHYAWRVLVDGTEDRLIDAQDESLSNWLRDVKCARHEKEENTAQTLCYGHIYFRTTRAIAPNTELLIFCGADYNDIYLDLDEDKYRMNDTGS